tara:strand:- start:1726 stop:1998 length:273 start_codon:yes stop_codon:yes gene_type:complete
LFEFHAVNSGVTTHSCHRIRKKDRIDKLAAVISAEENNSPLQINRGINLRASGQSGINHAVSSSNSEACHRRLGEQLRLLEDDNPCCVLN